MPDNRPVRGALRELLPLTVEQVRRGDEEALFNSLMEQYHYRGYEQPVGEHLKYVVKARVGDLVRGLVKRAAASG